MHDKVVGGVQKGWCACMYNRVCVGSGLITAWQVKYLFLSVWRLEALLGSKGALLCLAHHESSPFPPRYAHESGVPVVLLATYHTTPTTTQKGYGVNKCGGPVFGHFLGFSSVLDDIWIYLDDQSFDESWIHHLSLFYPFILIFWMLPVW